METVHYFDRLRIQSFRKPKAILEKIPVDELAQHCRKLHIGKGYKPWLSGYHSKIDIVAPAPAFLQHLNQYAIHLMPYAITYAEIAKDIPKPTEWDASKAVIDFNYRQKWARIDKIFFNDSYYSKSEYCGLMGKLMGSKYFKNCTYARFSKVTGEPAHHREWRIAGAKNIFDKSGLVTIDNLIDFDFQDFFQRTDDKYLVPAERTDQLELGMYLAGLGHIKNPTDRQLWLAGCTGAGYSKGPFAQTVQYLKSLKQDMKRHHQGNRSEIQERIYGLKRYDRFKKSESLY